MEDVLGQSVVLDDAPELRLIPVHDGEIIIVDEFVAVCRFAVSHVGLAMLFDNLGGNSQTNAAVDLSRPVGIELVVGALIGKLIAEEPRRLGWWREL